MPMRKAGIIRKTSETNVEIELNLDGTGKFSGKVPLGFLKHMLEQLAKHGCMDLLVNASGDIEVDNHHLTEDIAIALGQALEKALSGKEGIRRYGYALIPMDEALASAAVDISGRPKLVFNTGNNAGNNTGANLCAESETAGGMSIGMARHFFDSLALNARMTVHIELAYGLDTHHKIEAMFKAFARALRMAAETDGKMKGKIPSTKGSIGRA